MQSTEPSSVDAITFLSAQHRQVESLWSMLENFGTANKEETAQQIVRMLSQHDAIETQLLYPELRKIGGDEGNELSEHSLEEHQRVRELLKEVDRADQLDASTYEKLQACMAAVNHHVAEEEQRIFPLLQSRCDPGRLRQLGDEMAAMMAKAPTHPHPSTPDSKLGAIVAGAVTGLMDRARDRMSDDEN